MQVQLKNQQQIAIRVFELKDTTLLANYFEQLSNATKQRFAPHDFNEESIIELYRFPSSYVGFIATDIAAGNIIAYAVISLGVLPHEVNRLHQYHITPCSTDALFAPSVADAWQGLGIGGFMLNYIKQSLKQYGIRRLFLWGGVQTSNQQAINYYMKQGFESLGLFEYNGSNEDMMLVIAE
jgi:diamine N-acetyltransferase